MNSNNKNRLPASYNQRAIWHELHADPETTAYHCAIAWRVPSARCDLERLSSGWHSLLTKHELLRATFDDEDGDLHYLVLPPQACLATYEVDQLAAADDAALERLLRSLAREPIFLRELPATRIAVIRTGGDLVLLVRSHHLVMDAPSLIMVGSELLRALCGAPQPPARLRPSAPARDYHDFVAFQREQLESADRSAFERFFLSQTYDPTGRLRSLDLPARLRRTAGPRATQGGTVSAPLSAETEAWFSLQPASSRVAVMLAAWAIVLSRYCDQDHVITTTALSGRSRREWRSVVGHFVNVLPALLVVDSKTSVHAFVKHAKERLYELLEHQDIPLISAMSATQIKQRRAGLYDKPFQTFFNCFEDGSSGEELAALGAVQLEIEQQEDQFELSLWALQSKRGTSFQLKYRSDVLDTEIVRQMARHYDRALGLVSRSLTEDPECLIGSVLLIDADEEKRLLQLGAGARLPADTPGVTTVDDAFAAQAHATPAAIALRWGSLCITYQQLDLAVERFALRLRTAGVRRGEVVAVATSRFGRPDILVSMLAIWRVGGAYLAVDAGHPAPRISYMLEVAKCALLVSADRDLSTSVQSVLAAHSTLTRLPLTDPFVASTEDVRLSSPSSDNAPVRREASDIAYVLFTSGSTGKPKGVPIEHRGLLDLCAWMRTQYDISSADGFLQSTVPTFDVSVPELFVPLTCGGAVVMFGDDDDEHDFATLIRRHQVTHMSQVPSLFRVLLEELSQCPSLRHVICIGEVLLPELVETWSQLVGPDGPRLHNLYGPTEATVYATHFECRAYAEQASVPIGTPCAGMQCLVTDSAGRLVPIGVAGELCLGGRAVSPGYLGAPVSPDPFAGNRFAAQFQRVYRTGDYVRWDFDGNLQYLGRRDSRVKVRGHLIELGEIENAAQSHPEVQSVAALLVDVSAGSALSEAGGQRQIVLFVTPQGIDAPGLQHWLTSLVPSYMIPWRIVSTNALPATSNGKVDRKQLLQHFIAQHEAPKQRVDPDGEPETALSLTPDQATIANLWRSVLKTDAAFPEDNFYHQGGDSLAAMRVVALARRQGLLLRLPLPPTLAEQAACVQRLKPLATTATDATSTRDNRASALSRATVAGRDELLIGATQLREFERVVEQVAGSDLASALFATLCRAIARLPGQAGVDITSAQLRRHASEEVQTSASLDFVTGVGEEGFAALRTAHSEPFNWTHFVSRVEHALATVDAPRSATVAGAPLVSCRARESDDRSKNVGILIEARRVERGISVMLTREDGLSYGAQVQHLLEAWALAIAELDAYLERTPFVVLSHRAALRRTAPLFIVHGADGAVAPFMDLAQRLASPVVGVRYRAAVAARCEDLRQLAASYAHALCEAFPATTYRLAGHSFGALVAFEMAALLQRGGKQTAPVISLDAHSALAARGYVPTRRSELLLLLRAQRQPVSSEPLHVHDDAQLESLIKRWIPASRLDEILETRLHCLALLQGYEPFEEGGPRTIRVAARDGLHVLDDHPLFPEPGPIVHFVTGDHFTMLADPHVQALVNIINTNGKSES